MSKGKKAATPHRYPESILDPAVAPFLLDLHRAVEIETLWEAGTRLFQAVMPHYHTLVALPCVGIVPIFMRTTLPIRDIPNYWGQFIDADPPLAQIVRSHPGVNVSFLTDYFTDEQTTSTRFYRDFMQPDGWRYGMGFLFWDKGNFFGQFAAIRTEAQGDYTATERALLTDLYPHFEAAVHRVTLLDRERAARQAVQDGFKQAPEGRIVLDWNLSPAYTNQAALEACVNWSRGTHAQPVRAKELSAPFSLPRDIAAAAAELLAEFRDAVSKHNPKLRPWHATLDHPEIAGLSARLRILESDTSHSAEPHVLIELSRIISAQGRDTARPVYKLTSGERRVAELAASGEANQQIATTLGVSIHTVRAHLREIFSKLSISRRSQLSDVLGKLSTLCFLSAVC